MPTLDLLVQPHVTPDASRAADRALLARAVDTGRGTLRVHATSGDVLRLGRYHREPAGADGIVIDRRMTGGRPMAAGEGFIGMSLVLPHRSALVGDDPQALAPEQVMNRCVRGLLGALESAGVAALYPGRDLVTVDRRPIAALGFEVDARGAALFEAVVSTGREQSVVSRLLDRADVAGVVPAALVLPDDVASVQVPSIDAFAGWLRQGYAARLGVAFDDAPPIEADDAAPVAPPATTGCDRTARTPTMLGVLEAHVALAPDGTLARVALCGDLLAPSWAIAALEETLVGCSPDVARLAGVVERAMAAPGAFLLGVGPLRTVAETVARAGS
jgi:lipoate-protein ligase A